MCQNKASLFYIGFLTQILIDNNCSRRRGNKYSYAVAPKPQRSFSVRCIFFGKLVIYNAIPEKIYYEVLYISRFPLNKSLVLIFSDQAFADLINFFVGSIIIQSSFLPLTKDF